jgi:hypothetical protein
MYKTAWKERFMTLMGVKLRDLDRHRSKDEISHIVVTVIGSKAGRLNRLPIGYRLTFQRTNPCAFLTKPFIRLSTFKVAVLSSASW